MTKQPKNPDTTAPVRKKRGALLVHAKLREDIQWMRIAPGSALDEVALAKEYEVSRTPVREALLLLANEGFVQFLQNRTTIVAPLSMHNQAAFIDTFLLLSRGLIRAVAQNGPANRSPLDGFVAEYAQKLATGDSEGAFRAQLALFRQIAPLARNRFLSKYFIEAQDASVRTKLLYFFPHLQDADTEEATSRLEAIVDAVASADGEMGDAAVCAAILFETRVIQRGMGPRFGHSMSVVPDDGTIHPRAVT
jgi:DNA-binding GntR family transcriptional regulator